MTIRRRFFSFYTLAATAFWCLTAAVGQAAQSGQWPMYGNDAARSCVTANRVEPPLVECWKFVATAPEPAWGDPKPIEVEGYRELRRIHFDDALQPVTDGRSVYFGSSADNKVYCLDAPSGKLRWTRITGGPVRLAPTIVDGRLYVGSDDGFAYCLDAEDGSILWKFHAAPENQRVLGSGKMISPWPLRTGVLVDDGVAYFGAGIFPAEGVFLYALDAKSGELIWRNDTCGETPQSRISPQGYLLASKSSIYAPMGRVSPAAFDRATGKLKYQTYFGKSIGGTYALLSGDEIYTGTEEMIGYRQETRDRFAMFDGRRLVVTGDTAYVATETELSAFNRKTFPAASRRLYGLKTRQPDMKKAVAAARAAKDKSEAAQKQYDALLEQDRRLQADLDDAQRQFDAAVRWKTPLRCWQSLILAGDVLMAGGDGEVAALSAGTGKVLWTAKVDGSAKGLAAAGGRLLVSTDQGNLYSFGPKGSAQNEDSLATAADEHRQPAESPLSPIFKQVADTAIAETGVKKGYCLVLGCETGELALALASQSDLMIYVADADAEKVEAARKTIDAAGLYGTRICVDQFPADRIPYADYVANLIVSETAAVGGPLPDAAEVARLLKPCGGAIFVGQPDDGPKVPGVKQLEPAAYKKWLSKLGLESKASLAGDRGTWAKLVRGPLDGAGSWTHQYANPGNTACGDDQLVRCPLGVLWFGDPGPGSMVNRHRRAAAPLSMGGRLFIQGENVVMAYDVYNGVKLWERKIQGAKRENASHDGGNLAASSHGLFVAVGDECLRLDQATGKTVQTYHVPPPPEGTSSRWGYIATVGKTLFGSRGAAPIYSDCLFALDVDSGRTLWQFDGKRIANNTFAVGDGRAFLVDVGASQVVCLDATTGDTVWKQPIDLTDLGGAGLAAMFNDGVLVVFGVYLDGHYWQQFFAGEFDTRRMTAFSADDGHTLWSQPVGYRVRPLIIGDTLHAEPWAFNLHTGKPVLRVHPVTGEETPWQFARSGHHCGCPSASPNCLFFRSYCLGYYDLLEDSGTTHFGAQRPGCWINFIPAGGLLLMPEASVGCMCPFPNMCTVVFHPTSRTKGFTQYSAVGEVTPVRRLAVNLGAPGDRADSSGNLWFGYPRPFQGRLVLDFDVDAGFYPHGGFVERNSTYTPVADTDAPWLFASAAAGLRKCDIRLRGDVDGTALYRVRLLFADPDNDKPGRRVFDVKLQGKTVLEGLDIAAETGGRDRALVKEIDDVAVDDLLTIEMVSTQPRPPRDQAPILQAIEVIEQEVVSLGCRVPDFLLSNRASSQSKTLDVANFFDGPFEGTIRATASSGFKVRVGQPNIALTTGQRLAIPVEVTVAQDVAPGNYPLSVTLVGSDGHVEAERSAVIEHLGPRDRITVPATEDASLMHRYPDLNKGTASVLLVDGGNRKMGDEDHARACFKFDMDIPGKSHSVRFRIYNAGNPSGDAGRVCLSEGGWTEDKVTYSTQPAVGRELGRLGRVEENQVVDVPLDIVLEGKSQLALVIDPTSCDGIDFLTHESGKPAELIIEYDPAE